MPCPYVWNGRHAGRVARGRTDGGMGCTRRAREHESESAPEPQSTGAPVQEQRSRCGGFDACVTPPHLSHEQRAETWCNGMYMYGISPWSPQPKLGTTYLKSFSEGTGYVQGREFGVRKVGRQLEAKWETAEAGLGTGPTPRTRMMQPVCYRGLHPGGVDVCIDRSRILDPYYWGATARTRRCERTLARSLADPDSLFRGWVPRREGSDRRAGSSEAAHTCTTAWQIQASSAESQPHDFLACP